MKIWKALSLVLVCGVVVFGGWLLIFRAPRNTQAVDASAFVSVATGQPERIEQSPVPAQAVTDEDYTYEITIILEGNEETVTYRNFRSEKGYTIAYDIDRFTVETGAEHDSIVKLSDPSHIADYIDISLVTDVQTGAAEKLADALEDAGYVVGEINSAYVGAGGGYLSKHFAAYKGEIIKHYYLVNAQAGYYLIDVTYTLLTEEGYGARLTYLLDTFTQNDVK